MKTIFLAAGSSSRMNPIGDKNFLSFSGEALLLRLLRNAAQAGCRDFVIVGNNGNFEAITKICAENDFLQSAHITTQPRLEEGMAGGISAGLEFVTDKEAILIHNGNDLVEASAIERVIKATQENNGAILGQKRAEYFPGGYLEASETGKVLSIIEKPDPENRPSDLVNIVIHGFKNAHDLKNSLSQASSDQDDVYEVALDQLFKTKNFKTVEYSGRWQAIKYPWHVLEMMKIFLSEPPTNPELKEVSDKVWIHPQAEIADSAVIKGENVIIESGARVFENAVISGPCYIGPQTIIGNNALVRNSHIGSGSQIGFNTEVARSWLESSVTTHTAYLGDSVVSKGVNFGAFSCTANLRLDRENVKVKIKNKKIDSKHPKLGAIVGSGAQIGIGAKLMPGCKVPVEKAIFPGEIFKD